MPPRKKSRLAAPRKGKRSEEQKAAPQLRYALKHPDSKVTGKKVDVADYEDERPTLQGELVSKHPSEIFKLPVRVKPQIPAESDRLAMFESPSWSGEDIAGTFTDPEDECCDTKHPTHDEILKWKYLDSVDRLIGLQTRTDPEKEAAEVAWEKMYLPEVYARRMEAQSKGTARLTESADESERRRAANAARVRAHRAAESEDERTRRLARQANYAFRMRLSKVTEKSKLDRAANAARMRERRAAENDAERAARLARSANYKQQVREAERLAYERVERLFEMANDEKQILQVNITEIDAERLARNAGHEKVILQAEIAEKGQRERAAHAARARARRAAESDAQRAARLARSAYYMRQVREAERLASERVARLLEMANDEKQIEQVNGTKNNVERLVRNEGNEKLILQAEIVEKGQRERAANAARARARRAAESDAERDARLARSANYKRQVRETERVARLLEYNQDKRTQEDEVAHRARTTTATQACEHRATESATQCATRLERRASMTHVLVAHEKHTQETEEVKNSQCAAQDIRVHQLPIVINSVYSVVTQPSDVMVDVNPQLLGQSFPTFSRLKMCEAEDPHRSCRFCGSRGADMWNVFTCTADCDSAAMTVASVFNLQIEKLDGISEEICSNCWRDLSISQNFQQRIVKANQDVRHASSESPDALTGDYNSLPDFRVRIEMGDVTPAREQTSDMEEDNVLSNVEMKIDIEEFTPSFAQREGTSEDFRPAEFAPVFIKKERDFVDTTSSTDLHSYEESAEVDPFGDVN